MTRFGAWRIRSSEHHEIDQPVRTGTLGYAFSRKIARERGACDFLLLLEQPAHNRGCFSPRTRLNLRNKWSTCSTALVTKSVRQSCSLRRPSTLLLSVLLRHYQRQKSDPYHKVRAAWQRSCSGVRDPSGRSARTAPSAIVAHRQASRVVQRNRAAVGNQPVDKGELSRSGGQRAIAAVEQKFRWLGAKGELSRLLRKRDRAGQPA
jgi:hypothetical protein